jgi:tetratricopeptide (TPR) repeat protein
MRGTTDRNAFQDFVTAVCGFPPVERDGRSPQQVFNDSYDLLKKLAAMEPPFPRARAWQGYALALSVSEGWPFLDFKEEASMSADDRLDLALKLASAARDLDKTDYDLWWALANIYLIRREFGPARDAFKEALFLNTDEANPNLLAEAADAMVHLGDQPQAEKYIRQALRKPDWHHWIRAWAFFTKAGRTKSDESVFLDLALDHIKSTRAHPGEATYLMDIQLLLAAVHARKRVLLASVDGAAKLAERHRLAAERAIQRFLAFFPYWDVEQAVRFAPFSTKADADYWRSACEEAWKINSGL